MRGASGGGRWWRVLRALWWRAAPKPCPFCEIIRGEAPAALVPLGPVTRPPARHWLVVPRDHARDAVVDPDGVGAAVRRAAQLAKLVNMQACNMIVSVGAAATQTVWHTHVHLVERRAGDGLHLPWTGQQRHG